MNSFFSATPVRRDVQDTIKMKNVEPQKTWMLSSVAPLVCVFGGDISDPALTGVKAFLFCKKTNSSHVLRRSGKKTICYSRSHLKIN